MANVDPTGLDCINATDKGNYEIDHKSYVDDCSKNGGTWVPGYVDEGWVHYNSNNGQYQAGSIDGSGSNATVDYATFKAGAQTDANGNCTNGCGGYGVASANANWLHGMLTGNSHSGGLGGMVQFMVDFWNDHWAGPSGMGAPGGQGDWAAMVHDYNFSTNGPITIRSYFNPTLSPATSKALIQSNSNLIRNAGGVEGAKMGLFFGVVNAFQAYANSRK